MRIPLFLVALMTLSINIQAQGPESFSRAAYVDRHNDTLPYRLFSPTTEPGKRYPLVLFLHGSGEKGTDNEAQLKNGVFNFTDPGFQAAHPCYVLVPQCPDSGRWLDIPFDDDSIVMPHKASVPLAETMDVIRDLLRSQPVDKDRIYVTGLSMGGFGTFDLLARYPKFFAAGMPLCGGYDPRVARKFRKVPVWIFHGEKDDVVLPERSREMYRALLKAGGEPKYTEYPGMNHGIWDTTYSNREVLDWLFLQDKHR